LEFKTFKAFNRSAQFNTPASFLPRDATRGRMKEGVERFELLERFGEFGGIWNGWN
jgi:hypothetical protein